MVSDEHWAKIKKALTRLVVRDGKGGHELFDYFRTHDTMLYNEAALDRFLADEDAAELQGLRDQKAALEAEIARREA